MTDDAKSLKGVIAVMNMMGDELMQDIIHGEVFPLCSPPLPGQEYAAFPTLPDAEMPQEMFDELERDGLIELPAMAIFPPAPPGKQYSNVRYQNGGWLADIVDIKESANG